MKVVKEERVQLVDWLVAHVPERNKGRVPHSTLVASLYAQPLWILKAMKEGRQRSQELN